MSFSPEGGHSWPSNIRTTLAGCSQETLPDGCESSAQRSAFGETGWRPTQPNNARLAHPLAAVHDLGEASELWSPVAPGGVYVEQQFQEDGCTVNLDGCIDRASANSALLREVSPDSR